MQATGGRAASMHPIKPTDRPTRPRPKREPRGAGAAPTPPTTPPDRPPRHDPLTTPYQRADRLVLGADAVRVLDNQHAAAGDLAGESHHAGSCSQHDSAGADGQVDAEMAWPVWRSRWREPT